MADKPLILKTLTKRGWLEIQSVILFYILFKVLLAKIARTLQVGVYYSKNFPLLRSD